MTNGKFQCETRVRIGRISLKGVARGLKQVDVSVGKVVDEVEIIHIDVFNIHADDVSAIFASLKVKGHFTLTVALNHGIILIFLDNEKFGIVFIEHELGQLMAFVEIDDGAVNDTTALAEGKGESLALSGRSGGGEIHFLVVLISQDKRAFHGRDRTCNRFSDDFRTTIVQGVEGTVDIGGISVWVTHEVPTRKHNTICLDQGNLTTTSISTSIELQRNFLVVGIEVAHARLEVKTAVDALIINPFKFLILVKVV